MERCDFMPENIKINELEYITFLNHVKSYMEKTKVQFRENNVEVNLIEEYIEEQLLIRKLINERRLYYDFYRNNREQNPMQANQAYHEYMIRKKELEKIYKK